MRRCADHKRIIVAILIAALSILCAFYGNDSISEVHHTEQVCLQKSHTAISDTTLRKIEGTEIFETNLTSKMRSSERIERTKASRKNGCTVSYLACLAMQRHLQICCRNCHCFRILCCFDHNIKINFLHQTSC